MNNVVVKNVVNYLIEVNAINEESAQKENLFGQSVSNLIKDYILPCIVNKGGQDIRGWRLSPTFMKLMARFGADFVHEANEEGNILMELAMQRLSMGAVLHEGVHLIHILPAEYQKYSAAWDQFGIMDEACWQFVVKQLPFCLTSLKPAFSDHAKKILFGMLEHLTPEGQTTGDYMWAEDVCKVSVKEAWEWAEHVGVVTYSASEIAQHFAKTDSWRSHTSFLARYNSSIDWEQFFYFISLEREECYKGFHRKMLKLFGLYEKQTKKKLQKEILSEKK